MPFISAGAVVNVSASPANITLVAPSGIVATSIVLAVLYDDDGTNQTVTPPAGWILSGPRVNDGIAQGMSVYWALGNVASYVFGLNTLAPTGDVIGFTLAYSSVDNTTPMDAAAVGQSNISGTVVTASSITTVTASDTLVGLFGILNGISVWSAEFGTHRQSGGVAAIDSLDAADAVQVAIGASGVKTATSSLAGVSIGILVALRPAAGVAFTWQQLTEDVQRFLRKPIMFSPLIVNETPFVPVVAAFTWQQYIDDLYFTKKRISALLPTAYLDAAAFPDLAWQPLTEDVPIIRKKFSVASFVEGPITVDIPFVWQQLIDELRPLGKKPALFIPQAFIETPIVPPLIILGWDNLPSGPFKKFRGIAIPDERDITVPIIVVVPLSWSPVEYQVFRKFRGIAIPQEQSTFTPVVVVTPLSWESVVNYVGRYGKKILDPSVLTFFTITSPPPADAEFLLIKLGGRLYITLTGKVRYKL
jgi:hypothetical protein